MRGILAQSPDAGHFRFAIAFVAAIAAVGAASLALPDSRWAGGSALVPVYGTAVALAHALTAFLVALEFLAERRASLLWVAAAYAFSGATALGYLLGFFGPLAPQPSPGGGWQGSAWLWVAHHAGWPLAVCVAMLGPAHGDAPEMSRARVRRAIATAVVAPALLGALAVAIVIGRGAGLPEVAGAQATDAGRAAGLHAALVALNLAALLLVLHRLRLRSILGLWLAAAAAAAVVEVSIALLAHARYGTEWFVAGAIGVVASTAVPAAMLWETQQLYRRLVSAHERLAQQAMRDGLTGLYNRRAFDERFEEEFARARRNARPLSVLMIDIDFFKAFNDAFGHQAGDECLRRVAAALDAEFGRPGDFVARYGGEEFVVLLADTSAEGATHVADRARRAVAGLVIAAPRSASAAGVLTVSIGVATCGRVSAESPAGLLARADRALYEAKSSGRDRVVAAAAGP